MSTAFQIPEWLPQAPSSPNPSVDDHRVEALVNRFIAGKQEALFTAPDAFYRLEGANAVQGRAAIADRLQALRAATLDLAQDDGERVALGPRLDLHIDDATDGIDRHVAEQRRVYQRQIVSERQALIQRAAELEHDNDDKIMGLAEANASAAGELARMDGIVPGSPEERSAFLKGRSNILCTAIGECIGSGKGIQALALFDRFKDQLVPADRLSLAPTVQAARYDQLADQWIDRESTTDGPPLQQRLETDPDLPSDAKLIVRAKVDARDSAYESARAANVQALDDEVRDALRNLPTEAYRLGTFARLAGAYSAEGEPQKASDAQRLALQEPFLRAFAQASPSRQQRLIDSLPAQDRPAAEAIQSERDRVVPSEAFSRGAASDVHSDSPIATDTTDDDIETGRLIDAIYGVDQPGLASEPMDADGLLHRVQAVGDNKRQGNAAEDAEAARIKEIDPRAKVARQIRIYIEGVPTYMVADIIIKGNGTILIIIEVKTGGASLSPNQIKVMAEAIRTGKVYFTNAKFAEGTKIKPGVSFKEQRIVPEIYVLGGNSAKMERQMRNEGIDVRPAGVRGRMRIGVPPT